MVSTISLRNRSALFLLVTTLVTIAPAVAAHASERSGTYGAPFLRIPVGAKLMASPDIVAGMSPDASLVFSNPAFLNHVETKEIFMSTANWLDDLRLTAVSGVFPLRSTGLRFSFGSSLLYSGDLQGYDDALNVVSEESYYDLGLRAGITRDFQATSLGLGVSLGLGATYVRQHLPPEDGNGYAFTAGAAFQWREYMAHVLAKDIGGEVSFNGYNYPIDSQTMVGVGRVFRIGWGQLHAGAQVVFSDVMRERIQLGADYRFNRFFSLRTGVSDALQSTTAYMPLNAGFGLRYQHMSLEYAFTPQEFFSSTHTFSVAFALQKWGSPADPTTFSDETMDKNGRAREAMVPSQTPAGADRGFAGRFTLVSGTHSWLESAQAEARALDLLNIPARIYARGNSYRVVIESFDNKAKALSALRKYRTQGHKFTLAED